MFAGEGGREEREEREGGSFPNKDQHPLRISSSNILAISKAIRYRILCYKRANNKSWVKGGGVVCVLAGRVNGGPVRA